jgi:TolA-binding protein
MTATGRRDCPEAVELTRALTLGADAEPAVRAHVAACERCRAAWTNQQEIIALGRQLPFERPAADRLRLVRGTVLAAARLDRGGSPRRGAAVIAVASFAGAAAITALATGLLLHRDRGGQRSLVAGDSGTVTATATEPAPADGRAARRRSPADIRAGAGTRFTVLSGPPHEKVELQEGALRVSVEPATGGETFRIVTRRGEVEVRGTIFETVASSAGLTAVRVERGRVVVRPGPGQEVILTAGQDWQVAPGTAGAQATAPVIASPVPLAPIASRPGRRHSQPGGRPRLARAPASGAPATGSWGSDDVAPGAPAAPREAGTGRDSAPVSGAGPAADPADRAFGEGLSLFRAGDPAAAARAFERALALGPAAALAEDVWYWRAVALARAGAGGPAREALGTFIGRFPLSARAGEVSVILGRLLQDSGDRAGAESRFRAGLHDRSARVREAARAGLEALRADAGKAPR